MIALKIEAENIAALRGTLADLLASLTPDIAAPAAPAPALQGEVLMLEPAKAPGKRGPKPKAAAPSEDNSTEAQAAPAAPAPDVAAAPALPSYDEVVNACKNLLGAKGMPALRELLQKFGVEQTKALKDGQYAEVIAAAEAAQKA